MLRPNETPTTEPQLRVGIILPEDNYTEIHISASKSSACKVYCSTYSQNFKPGESFIFRISGNAIGLNSDHQSDQWTIIDDSGASIGPSSGLCVKQVIAGRGFHWQKKIDAYLPARIEISASQGKMVLINECPLEHYLMCVATSEMGTECPDALIESQTIVARSWMLANVERKHVNLGMDVCNDDCCQRYQGTGNLSVHSIQGAERTRGMVLMYDEKICDARYSKSCGGIMEIFPTIWGGSDVPYLKPLADAPDNFNHPKIPLSSEKQVRDWINDTPPCYCSPHFVAEDTLQRYLGSVDESGTYFRWIYHCSQEELTDLLNRKLDLNATSIVTISPAGRGASGRIIACRIEYKDTNNSDCHYTIDRDVNIRAALHDHFLYSSCFYVDREGSDQTTTGFSFHGAGWGHGVGLCQIGALGMGLAGHDSKTIIQHYYPGSVLLKIYE
jgi:peptidoglycan hydrolase-like amidase